MKNLGFKWSVVTALLVGAFVLPACDRNRSGKEIAEDNARSYLRGELGADSSDYEEVSWGPLEARRLEFSESKVYHRYVDTVQRFEERVTKLSDSIAHTTASSTPAYMEMTARRDVYQRDLDLYRQREPDLRMRYEQYPEFDGYWIEHQYRVRKDPPIRVKILLGDTVKYTPSGLIYR